MTTHCAPQALRAPFPWFGGKSRAASIIWDAFGDVPNYVEPFAGSLAVLLNRPHAPHTETVNDLDCYLANFWRALSLDPEPVIQALDWPVNEADLHARHLWLIRQTDFRERMKTDPDYYDPLIAGWWVWGLCQWIGTGWCDRQRGDGCPSQQLPHLGDAGRGVHRKLPHLSAGRGELTALAERLRYVRVACGDWARVTSDAVTFRHGLTGIVLDPPYGEGEQQYAAGGNDTTEIAQAVREWAIQAGTNPQIRIALCGYDGQYLMPATWRCEPWKARKGYQSTTGDSAANPQRERIWFSPHCLGAKQPGLFG